MELIPVIREESAEKIQEQVDLMWGKIDKVGVEIIDGVLVDDLSVGVGDLRGVDFRGLQVDVWLMTEYPGELLGECRAVGLNRVVGQVERMGSQEEFVGLGRELGLGVGLGVDLHTPVDELEVAILENGDKVLLLGTELGKVDAGFEESVLVKVQELRELGFGGVVGIRGVERGVEIRKCVEAEVDEVWVGGDWSSVERLNQVLAEIGKVG